MTWLFAFVAAALATPAIRAFARKQGIVANPNPLIPQHTKPIAYLGGVAAAIGASVGLLGRAGTGIEAARPLGEIVSGVSGYGLGLTRPWGAVVLCSALYLGVGLLDDLKTFRPRAKLLLQLLVATTAVSAGLRAPLTGLPSIDAGLTVFWIVAVVNALNFMDVCDGLVAGTSVIFLFGAGLIVGGVPVWWAFSGAAAGFLLYNRPRASIFLGDAGSHFFGFLAAAVGIQIVQSQGNWPGLLSLGLLLVLPLFELVYVTGVRVANGDPIWKGSGDHVALRLQHAGLSSWKTIGLMWSLGLVGAVAATRVAGLGEGGQSALAAGSILVLALFAFLISRCPPPPPETKSGSQDRGATPSEPPQID